jgi:hypothetical protein
MGHHTVDRSRQEGYTSKEQIMKQMSTEIEISADVVRVWKVLTDFARFPEWNPLIRSAEGQAKVGDRIKVYLKPPKGMGMTFKPTVLQADEGREFRWLGHLLIPGLFDGEHYFTIESLEGGRVRFTQGEIFRGLLVPVMGLLGVFKNTNPGFEEMNGALKVRAENPQVS